MARKLLRNLALLTTLAVAYNEASAQYPQFYQLYNSIFGEDAPKAKTKGKRPANPIYGKDLTVAGNGLFLTSYVTPSRADNDGSYDLTKQFSSKDKIRYSALTAAKVKQIIDNAKVDKNVKARIRALQQKAGKNRAINHKRFSDAIKDGKLTKRELFMLEEGTYAYLVTTGRQGVVGFYEVGKNNGKSLEQEIQTPSEQELDRIKRRWRLSPEAKQDTTKADTTSRIPAKTLEEAAKDTSMIAFPRDKTEVEADSGKSISQYAQPIDMVVHGDSGAVAQGYVPADSLKKGEVSPDTTEPFMRETADSLILLRNFGKLTKTQKSAWNRSVSDAVRNKGFQRVSYGIYVRKKEETEGGRPVRFGLNVGASNSEEIVAGTYLDFPLSDNFDLETFAEWSIRNGKPYFTSSSYDVTTRQLKFVTPSTRERRVDDTTTVNNETPLAEAGVALNYLASDWLEFGFGAGIQALKNTEKINGSSTVSLERNGVVIRGPETISSYGEKASTKAYPTFRAGLRLKPWKGLTLELMLKRTGIKKGENHARFDLGWKF